MSELQELKLKRGHQKAALTRIKKYIDSLDLEIFDQKTYFEIKARLEKLSKINETFEEIQNSIDFILELEKLDTVEDEDYRIDFENSFYSLYAEMENIIQNFSNSNSKSSLNLNNSSEIRNLDKKRVKLPTIQLPTFDGEYKTWITFRDTFKSLIHDQGNMNNIEKFHYLKACLKGDASYLIESLQISEENYEVAFKTLINRYDNKKLLIHHHLKLIFETPIICKESFSGLRKLVDDVKTNVSILTNLGINTCSWDSWLLYLISTKLDVVTRLEWEEHTASIDMPLLKEFYDFIHQRCQFLERLNSEKETTDKRLIRNNNAKSSKFFKTSTVKNLVSSEIHTLCPHCKQDHKLFNCQNFLELPIQSRYQTLKQLRLCLNCMKPNHVAKACIAGGCKQCGMKHNTLLHFELQNSQQNNSSIMQKDTKNESPLISASTTNNGEVLLSTALVRVIGKNKQEHIARILLDSGSQSNFVTREFFNKLNIKSRKINQPVTGIGQQRCFLSDIVDLEVHSCTSQYNFKANFLVIDNITEKLPHSEVNVSLLQIPENIALADPQFSRPGRIDMLLGASTFWTLICIGQIKLNAKQTIMQKTKLGWIISGLIPHRQNSTKNSICNFISLEKQLEKFWAVEEIKSNSLSKYESTFENNFKNTLRRRNDGHFEVGLPVKQNVTQLGDSFNQAYSRFLQLEKKLNNSDVMKNQYVDFMTQYEKLGHMSLVTNEKNSEDNFVYYLPHHGVFKETSITTKLRVVFDGSSKSDTGLSLNDVLISGSVLQDDLFSILLRFRKHTIVIASDIEKMYRQVYIIPQHRDLQRILWRSNNDEPIKKYRLNTVTYGTTSGSFLAIRCLHEVANIIEKEHPDISQIIREDFYVDDLLTGGETAEEVLRLQALLSSKLQEFGFPLRKWNSNNPSVLHQIVKQSECELKHLVIEDNLTKTLGLGWDAKGDYLQYSIHIKHNNSPTKRSILAAIAKIFDPLGLLGPIITLLKVLMQELWRSQIHWDESLPQDIYSKWIKYQSDWKYINEITVPRQITCPEAVDIQLHGFCDASQVAYGACMYLVSENKFGQKTVKLICSKSRVVPLKSLTIPRLELCAALLLSRLSHKVSSSMRLQFSNTWLWTDSQITLAWITKEPHQWKIFVAHRVAEIQQLTKHCIWRHISGTDNPADIISRGMCAEKLLHFDLWWNGPQWLMQSQSEWPIHHQSIESFEIPEQKTITTMITSVNSIDIFGRFSTFRKLQHVMAYILRFIYNCKGVEKRHGLLLADELQEALMVIIKIVQKEVYGAELKCLQARKPISNKSKLLPLNPFLDKHDIIRVGGRLQKSDLNFEERHQIIIPGAHKVTELLIKHQHHKQLHTGSHGILYSLRQRFWVTGGLNTIKRVLRKCITCFRTKPIFYKHQMGELPKNRIIPSQPFQNCGVDYAGPIKLKSGTLKNSKITKGYICIFICFATKAVHIELVSDLTTEFFLNTLKRFIARRGKPKTMYSDNGTNFVGAYNEIKRMEKSSKVSKFIAEEGITWKFIPPRSPHFGGLWEAAVKSAKTHLKRVIGETILTFEELYTVLVQIEACLNSRPLSPMSDDPNDLNPLTPAHFLMARAITCLPEENVLHLPQSRRSRYHHLMFMVQHFWSRWSKEYLSNLQQRTKWRSETANSPKIGDLVLISDETMSPLQWHLGRITQLHQGSDGIARVAKLKTASGDVIRAIRKLCPLPLA